MDTLCHEANLGAGAAVALAAHLDQQQLVLWLVPSGMMNLRQCHHCHKPDIPTGMMNLKQRALCQRGFATQVIADCKKVEDAMN